MSKAVDSTGIHAAPMGTFLYIIERNLQIIHYYKNLMSVWELNFYLEYLYNEITSEGINLVLFDLCLHSNKQTLELVKELNFDRFANTTVSSSRREDFRLLDYILNEKPDKNQYSLKF